MAGCFVFFKIMEFEMEMVAWEDMPRIEQLQCIYWDMYKDAYNVRPRGVNMSDWTEADFEMQLNGLEIIIQRNTEQRRIEEAFNEINVDETIAKLIKSGAKDRAMAIRWLHEAHDTCGDDSYLEFHLGVGYGFFKRTA
jgi:hypothetical protein